MPYEIYKDYGGDYRFVSSGEVEWVECWDMIKFVRSYYTSELNVVVKQETGEVVESDDLLYDNNLYRIYIHENQPSPMSYAQHGYGLNGLPSHATDASKSVSTEGTGDRSHNGPQSNSSESLEFPQGDVKPIPIKWKREREVVTVDSSAVEGGQTDGGNRMIVTAKRRLGVTSIIQPLSKPLQELSLIDLLRGEPHGKEILRQLGEGLDLTGEVAMKQALFRCISAALLRHSRIPDAPTPLERSMFIARVLQAYPQFDPVSISRSTGPVAKHAYYHRKRLSNVDMIKLRGWKRTKEEEEWTMEQQRLRQASIGTTPPLTTSYRTLVDNTRKWRLSYYRQHSMDEVSAELPYLLSDHSIVLNDFISTQSAGLDTILNRWNENVTGWMEKLKSVGADLDQARQDTGYCESAALALSLLRLMNARIPSERKRASESHFFNIFETASDPAECVSLLRRSNTPKLSIYRVGALNSLHVYLGRCELTLPLDLPRTVLTIIALKTLVAKVSYPPRLAQLFNLFSCMLEIRNVHPHHNVVSILDILRRD